MWKHPELDTGYGPNDEMPGHAEPQIPHEIQLLDYYENALRSATFHKEREAGLQWSFLIERGRFYRAADLPPEFGPVDPGASPQQLSLDHPELTYVEGYVLRHDSLKHPHAWCTTEDGTVVDIRSEEPEAAYFGVPISRERLMEHRSDQSPGAKDKQVTNLNFFFPTMSRLGYL